ncbi:MAG: acetyl-CoA carboxylase, biotin carboxyl carrier protein [Candidatus Nephrothrix sp. EaCA]|nr:MAG: acetyl-CoA carboxylase, biotin carboxyl carrier protein [Candidatus Nephrothrix sp. EaCA]
MKTSEIRDLIDFIAQTGLNEVDIETSEIKLHVKRAPDHAVLRDALAPAPTAAPVLAAPAAETRPEPLPPDNAIEIKSPMIGTFYRSGKPDAPPFVSAGDKIKKGTVVGIIEAMKLFNEIESEVSGTVIKVMAENSMPVEFDQVLFIVEPD